MAYSPANLVTIGSNGRPVMSVSRQPGLTRNWTYQWTDAMTVVRAANYISDAVHRGMQVGDTVTVVQMTGAAVTAVTIAAVMAVAPTGADLSDGTAISVVNT